MKMVRAIACLTLALLLVISMSTCALAEHCEYGSESSCDVKWLVDVSEKKHCRACFNHVEDKGDSFSHARITDWEACSPDEGGVCTGCGWDYIRDVNTDEYNEAFMKEFFTLCIQEEVSPIDFEVSGSTLSIGFSDFYMTSSEEYGVTFSIPESMYVDTEYQLSLSDGSTYAYTGSAIKPAILTRSEYGPVDWLIQNDLIEIGNIVYKNNVNPGTATASVTFAVKGKTEEPFAKTLSVNFTITGDDDPSGGGDDPSGGNEEKKQQLIETALGKDVITINGLMTGAAKIEAEEIDWTNGVDHSGLDMLLEDAAKDENTVVAVYNINLSDGEIAQGEEAILTLPVAGYEGWTVLVAHGLGTGELETFTRPVVNEKVQILVSSFSPFAIIALEAPAVSTDLPETGDSSSLALWMTLMSAAMAGLVVCSIRKKITCK